MPVDTKDFLKTLPADRRRKIAKRTAELRAEYMSLQEPAAPAN